MGIDIALVVTAGNAALELRLLQMAARPIDAVLGDGGDGIPAAFKDKKLARYLVRLLETSLTRAVDKQDAAPLLDELRKFIGDDQA